MCETAREKWLNKIPIILLLFSNFQATWSDGMQMEKYREKKERHCLWFSEIGDVAERLFVEQAKIKGKKANQHYTAQSKQF